MYGAVLCESAMERDEFMLAGVAPGGSFVRLVGCDDIFAKNACDYR